MSAAAATAPAAVAAAVPPLNFSKILKKARGLARFYAASAGFHIEIDDLVDAALIGKLQGQPLQYAIIDELRRMGGRWNANPHPMPVKHFLHWQPPASWDTLSQEEHITENLSHRQYSALLQSAISTLPPRLQQLAKLRFIDELSQLEIGHIMGFACHKDLGCPRVSQLEKQVRKLLRAELESRGIHSVKDVLIS